jgi:hypothetical protein
MARSKLGEMGGTTTPAREPRHAVEDVRRPVAKLTGYNWRPAVAQLNRRSAIG